MISKKTISRLLAGASLATLGIAASSRASAASFTGATPTTFAASTTFGDFLAYDIGLGTFTNNGVFSDGLRGTGTTAAATAVYIDTDSVIGEFVNNGTIQAIEDADGNNTSAYSATAVGLYSVGDVDLLTNNGLIDAYAFAHDFVSSTGGYAQAYADATGVDLSPDGDVHTDFTNANNGTLASFAGVHVESTGVGGDAYGWAEAIGVRQSANNLGGAPHVLNFTNTSNSVFDVDADAQIFADDYADGGAEAYGVYQYARDMDTAAAVANNYSGFNVQATSNVVAVYGGAENTYTGAVGIWQDLVAGDSYETADGVVRNEAEFYVGVDADADITNGYYATALGGGLGVYQDIREGDETSAEFENIDSFTVGVDVDAIYSFSGTYAGAQAYGTGVRQELYGDGATTVTGDFTSSGDFMVAVDGYAKGETYAVAGAHGWGLYQEGWSADEVRLNGETSGTFEVAVKSEAEADTFAIAGEVYTFSNGVFAFEIDHGANAFGAVQEADSGGGLLAESTFENSAEFLVSAYGKAVANTYVAVAGAYALGVEQDATSADVARNRFTNSSPFGVYSEADADGAAFALAATVDYEYDFGDGDWRLGLGYGAEAYGVDQYARSNEGDLAENLYTSNDEFVVAAVAKATAQTYAAIGAAYASGADQDAANADITRNSFTNTAPFTVTGAAEVAAPGLALAAEGSFGYYGEDDWRLRVNHGVVSYGLNQEAESDYGSLAENLYTSDGEFLVSSYSKALGGLGAVAGAYASGVEQTARRADTAQNTFTNNAPFTVMSQVEAEADWLAIAATLDLDYEGDYDMRFEVGYGAEAFGVDQYARSDSGILAENKYSNSSEFLVSAYAKAAANTYVALGGAYAFGLDQDAVNADVARNSFTNTGGFTVMGMADVSAPGLALAVEGSFGFYGEDDWRLRVNHGVVGYGINQQARSDYGSLAENLYTSDEAFLVSSHAKASGILGAIAGAYASGVEQTARRADTVRNTFTNNAPFTVMSQAEAEGDGLAIVGTVDLDYEGDSDIELEVGYGAEAFGVDQYARSDSGLLAENKYSNSGDFLVSAYAKAVATSFAALGGGYALGLDQDARNGDISRNSFANTASFAVVSDVLVEADLIALGVVGEVGYNGGLWWNIEAGSYAKGVDQRADSDEDLAENTYSNTGDFLVSSSIKAVSQTYIAVGLASAVGVEQEADDAFEARNSFESSGTFSVLGNAQVEAGAFGIAQTYISGAIQNADGYGGGTAENTFSNTGDFLVSGLSSVVANTYAAAMGGAFGVDQRAEQTMEGAVSRNTFSNTAPFLVQDKVTANAENGFAIAYAYSAGVGQVAEAYDSYPFAEGSLAENTFENTSSFASIADAEAMGAFVSGIRTYVYNTTTYYVPELGVYAGADGVNQWAYESDTSRNSFSNSGEFLVSARAYGVADYFGMAEAEAFGVDQYVYVPNSGETLATLAQNQFENTSAFQVAALAEISARTYAVAGAYGFGVDQYAQYADTTENVFGNTSSFVVDVQAKASGDHGVFAEVDSYGVEQHAYGPSNYPYEFKASLVQNQFDNAGTFQISGLADAQGGTYVGANSYLRALNQNAYYGDTNQNLFANSGDFIADSRATAAVESSGFGYAEADVRGVNQYSSSTYASDPFYLSALVQNEFSNSGQYQMSALAEVNGGTYISADAGADGATQNAYYGDVTQNHFSNTGTFGVFSEANALANGGLSWANGYADGLYQYASGGSGYNFVDSEYNYLISHTVRNVASNEGEFTISALGKAVGATYAVADFGADGADQNAYGGNLTYNEFTNSGTFAVSAEGEAESTGFSSAYAYGGGLDQEVSGNSSYDTGVGYRYMPTVRNSFDNAGDFLISSNALATGGTYAGAYSFGYGVEQQVSTGYTGLNVFQNSGSLQVASDGSATGDIAYATISAGGYLSDAYNIRASYTTQFRNDEDAEIVAMGTAEAIGKDYGFAAAYAYGVEFDAENYYYDPVGEEYVPGASLNLDGKNKGVIYSMAQASASADSAANEYALANAFGVAMFSDTGITGQFTNSGPGSITAEAYATGGDGAAWAVGIFDPSTANDAKILNKGDITAYAEGPNAYATGIAVAGAPERTYVSVISAVDPGSAQAQITNNGGSIWAGVSTDGGKTIYRGNAINTDGLVVGEGDAEVTLYEAAPNEVVVTLKNTRSDEAAQIFGNIDITDDDTVRVIKGWTRLDGIVNPDDELSGDLTISKDGKLTLANTNDLEGPSKVYVDTFAVKKKGTLNFEMTPDSAPMVKANSGKLKGTFAATYLPDFYGKKAVYNNAIELDERTGKFAKVVDNSYVIDTKLRYDGNDNVDLIVKRSGFGDTDGLNGNQQAVGDAIESVYKDLNGKGDFSDMVQNLTLIDNKSGYEDALNQLTGAEYAQLAQSVLWSTTMLNSSVTDRMDCGLNWTPGAGSNGERGPDACFEPGTFQMWGRISGSWNNMDGDSYAPGFDESQGGFYVGGDYAVNDNVFVGLAGGYFTSDMDFDSWGGRGGASFNYDGGQIALYGGWDNSQSYFRNILSYGFYNGSSHRDVGIGSSPVDPSGSYDANVWSYYGEVGHRFAVVDEVSATPFFGLGLATADIGSFVEKDPLGTGAGLKITGTDANSTATHLGVRVNGNWGAFSPEAYLAWKHEFSGTRQGVNATFASAPKGASFKVKGSDPGADALLLGLGGAISVGDSSDIVVRYDGAFYNGYNSQAGTVRWTTKF